MANDKPLFNDKKLYEILIPIKPNEGEGNIFICDNLGRYTDEYHQEFLTDVINKVGGYTRCPIVEGAWMGDGELYKDEMIPVRIFTDQYTLGELALFAKHHYEQKSIFVGEIGTAYFF